MIGRRMSVETVSVNSQGDLSIELVLHALQQFPAGVVEDGHTFQIQTKEGGIFHCFVKFIDIGRHPQINLPFPYLGGQRYYLMVENEESEVIAVRIINIFDEEKRLFATSYIRIHPHYRGKGIAAGIDEELVKLLQTAANVKKKSLYWQIENQNLTMLQKYKAGTDSDPLIVATLELEQARWMRLYGPGGRFEKRIFEPELLVIQEIGDATHMGVEEAFQ